MMHTTKSAVLLPGKVSRRSWMLLRAEALDTSMETRWVLASESLELKSYHFLLHASVKSFLLFDLFPHLKFGGAHSASRRCYED